MTTSRELIHASAATEIVVREEPLQAFGAWLASTLPSGAILNVVGAGGVGKTALLHTFAHHAHQLGWSVIAATSREVAADPSIVSTMLSSPMASDVSSSARPVVILLDCSDLPISLPALLEESLLPGLAAGVRLVITSRSPLSQGLAEDSPWRRVVQPLVLGGFSSVELEDYLCRCGLTDPALRAQVVSVAGNHPLSVAHAADLVLLGGVRNLEWAPEWRLALRGLIERMAPEAADPDVREVLEACAVVRQFDQATLAAMLETTDAGGVFDRLCLVAGVRPAAHGLSLHPDLRRLLLAELRWRNPERYRLLRARVQQYLQTRAQRAPAEDRGWLTAERLFVATDQPSQFPVVEEPELRVQPAHPDELPLLQELVAPGPAQTIDAPSDVTWRSLVAAVLTWPPARVHLARDPFGVALGFSLALPLCTEALSLLRADGSLAAALDAWYRAPATPFIPARPEATNAYCLLTFASQATPRPGIHVALLRQLAELFAEGGTYFVYRPPTELLPWLERWGFETLPARDGEAGPAAGYVLDLTQLGSDQWLEALGEGAPPPRPLRPIELEEALQDVLRHWNEDAWLAQSVLLAHLPHRAAATSPAEAIRRAIRQLLAVVRAEATASEALAYRAIELVYLRRVGTAERIAERLCVSRASLYRLLGRGVKGLAHAWPRVTDAAGGGGH